MLITAMVYIKYVTFVSHAMMYIKYVTFVSYAKYCVQKKIIVGEIKKKNSLDQNVEI